MVWRQGELFAKHSCELCRRQTDTHYDKRSDQYLCEDCEANPKGETNEADPD